MTLKEEQWTDLLDSIEQHKCTPFIGAGACSFQNEDGARWLPLGKDIAKKWAEEYDYPLEESSYQLPMVAQFLAIENGDDMYPKKILSRELKQVNPPNFFLEKFRNTPYAVLADLNLPIYITTNYDQFMESALKSRARDPVSEFCRWNNYAKLAGIPSAFDKPRKYKPKESEPLVYHLHGDVNTPQSMVLTERDYFDFVVNLNKDPEALMLPAIVRQALATSSLLFIGYTLEDISFRAIFQGVIGLQGTRFREISVSVQLPPPLTSEKVDKAQRYLDQYTRNMFEVRVFWGDVCQFVAELRQRWEGFKSGVVTS
jgi:hypothetical protein